MTFNWFNRNNNPPAESATPGADPAAPIESGPETTSESPDSEALLNYAKQAYENLKQQKAASAEAPEAEAPEAEAPEVQPTQPDKLYVAPADDSALPFWARAEADRDVRLARLRETAIQAPETPVAPVSDVTAPANLEAFQLDGDFLWSMEVLAMEGRRPEDITIEELTWLKQLRQGLDRTRRSLINSLRSIVGQGPLNEAGVLEIEALLLQADVGVQATDRIIAALQAKLKQEVLPPEAAIAYLKQILRELLEEPLQGKHRVAFVPEKDQLNIWLITGVNGAGKTTTIGKLAHIASKSGYKCLIAAADTFRAAAVEQVKVWGERSDVEVIANAGKNTDPAAVVFDGILAAQSRGSDLLLVDTAGRLQNKKNLMDELSKIRRIIDKNAAGARVESLLVLDATLGQNGLQQAKIFAEAAQLSGVVLTKLDGTAKGGIALAVVQQLGLPIRFIGAGEGIEDLRPFSSYEFVEALVSG
jgi:fused signal recognition particle receptor